MIGLTPEQVESYIAEWEKDEFTGNQWKYRTSKIKAKIREMMLRGIVDLKYWETEVVARHQQNIMRDSQDIPWEVLCDFDSPLPQFADLPELEDTPRPRIPSSNPSKRKRYSNPLGQDEDEEPVSWKRNRKSTLVDVETAMGNFKGRPKPIAQGIGVYSWFWWALVKVWQGLAMFLIAMAYGCEVCTGGKGRSNLTRFRLKR